MLVKFKSENLESRVRMTGVPRGGDMVLIQGELYEATRTTWDVDSSNGEQTVIVSIRRSKGSAKND